MQNNKGDNDYEKVDHSMREMSYRVEVDEISPDSRRSNTNKKQVIKNELQDILDRMQETHDDAENAEYINKIRSSITNLDGS